MTFHEPFHEPFHDLPWPLLPSQGGRRQPPRLAGCPRRPRRLCGLAGDLATSAATAAATAAPSVAATAALATAGATSVAAAALAPRWARLLVGLRPGRELPRQSMPRLLRSPRRLLPPRLGPDGRSMRVRRCWLCCGPLLRAHRATAHAAVDAAAVGSASATAAASIASTAFALSALSAIAAARAGADITGIAASSHGPAASPATQRPPVNAHRSTHGRRPSNADAGAPSIGTSCAPA